MFQYLKAVLSHYLPIIYFYLKSLFFKIKIISHILLVAPFYSITSFIICLCILNVVIMSGTYLTFYNINEPLQMISTSNDVLYTEISPLSSPKIISSKQLIVGKEVIPSQQLIVGKEVISSQQLIVDKSNENNFELLIRNSRYYENFPYRQVNVSSLTECNQVDFHEITASTFSLPEGIRQPSIDPSIGGHAINITVDTAFAGLQQNFIPMEEVPVQQPPVQPPVADAPVQAPVADAPVQPPVADAPVQPPVADAPVQPPVQAPVVDAPVQPPVQAPVVDAPLGADASDISSDGDASDMSSEETVSDTSSEADTSDMSSEESDSDTVIESVASEPSFNLADYSDGETIDFGEAGDAPAQPPVQAPVAYVPVRAPVADAPVQAPVADAPVQLPVQGPVAADPVQPTLDEEIREALLQLPFRTPNIDRSFASRGF